VRAGLYSQILMTDKVNKNHSLVKNVEKQFNTVKFCGIGDYPKAFGLTLPFPVDLHLINHGLRAFNIKED
jgi:hypothetical protein